jgi:TatD DNase family protein
VRHFLSVGVDAGSSYGSIELARRESGVLAAIGVHPARVGAATGVGYMHELAQQPEVVAIGEVGLDNSVGREHLPAQAAFFGACLKLAAELDKAVVLHVIGAHRQAAHILSGYRALRTVVHYFQGDGDLAWMYIG